jgi:hypothetical protein
MHGGADLGLVGHVHDQVQGVGRQGLEGLPVRLLAHGPGDAVAGIQHGLGQGAAQAAGDSGDEPAARR